MVQASLKTGPIYRPQSLVHSAPIHPFISEVISGQGRVEDVLRSTFRSFDGEKIEQAEAGPKHPKPHSLEIEFFGEYILGMWSLQMTPLLMVPSLVTS